MKIILVMGAMLLCMMVSCASTRLNSESGADKKDSSQPKATSCFTHHVTESAIYMQCF